MADELVKSIKCGEFARGHGEVTSQLSGTYGWTDFIGYGRAHDNAVGELDKQDAACKAAVVEKVNKWIESVECVPSERCKVCRIFRPNHVRPDEVSWEDTVHETGNPVKKGTLSVQRTYKGHQRIRSMPM